MTSANTHGFPWLIFPQTTLRLDTMKLKLAMQSRFDAQNKSTIKTCKDPSKFLKQLTNGQPICDRPHPAGAPEDVSLRLAAVHQQVAPRQRLDAQLLCAALQRRGRCLSSHFFDLVYQHGSTWPNKSPKTGASWPKTQPSDGPTWVAS